MVGSFMALYDSYTEEELERVEQSLHLALHNPTNELALYAIELVKRKRKNL